MSLGLLMHLNIKLCLMVQTISDGVQKRFYVGQPGIYIMWQEIGLKA